MAAATILASEFGETAAVEWFKRAIAEGGDLRDSLAPLIRSVAIAATQGDGRWWLYH